MAPTQGELARVLTALLIATTMAVRGRRRNALSPSGAIAAFLVGAATFSSGLRFGAAMLMFYIAGTRATRFGAARKKRVEVGYAHVNGNRSAAQVLGSSLPGALLSVAYTYYYRDMAPLDASHPARTMLQLSVLLFFAACAGDTLSSEIGSVAASGHPVLLIAPWRVVPPGVNGAVSLVGTVASVVGGVVVAAAFAAFSAGDANLMPTLVVGAAGGFVGSALDSVLGALLQPSWYDPSVGKVLKETPVPGTPEAQRARLVCGVDLLSGESVNMLAATLTCALAPLLVPLYEAPSW